MYRSVKWIINICNLIWILSHKQIYYLSLAESFVCRESSLRWKKKWKKTKHEFLMGKIIGNILPQNECEMKCRNVQKTSGVSPSIQLHNIDSLIRLFRMNWKFKATSLYIVSNAMEAFSYRAFVLASFPIMKLLFLPLNQSIKSNLVPFFSTHQKETIIKFHKK